MTSVYLEQWLKSWDKALGLQKRKILLFLDNAPCHPLVSLKNIKLQFLPKNTTSHLQPLDQGIIKTFKVYYRHKVLRRVINFLNEDRLASELAKDIDIKYAVKWAASAWNEVKPVTIKNYFKEAGFSTELDEVEEEPEDVDLSDMGLDIDLD
jgi:hypothetical protein